MNILKKLLFSVVLVAVPGTLSVLTLNAMNECTYASVSSEKQKETVQPHQVQQLKSVPSFFNVVSTFLGATIPDQDDTAWFDTLPSAKMQQHIKKAHYLNHKTFFRNEPIDISLQDIDAFGLLSKEFATSSMGEFLANIIEGLVDHADLAHNLDIINENPCMARQANQLFRQIFSALKTLNFQEMQQLYQGLSQASVLKMGLSLACAQKYQINLGTSDYNDFVANSSDYGVNQRYMMQKSALVSSADLHHLLPLLEPMLNKPIMAINFSASRLTYMPGSIGNLINLRELYLDNNQLESLPESLGNLVNLKKLMLYGNELKSLPNSLGNLTRLETLNAWHNQLKSLPASLITLKKLTDLNLRYNQLTHETKQQILKHFARRCDVQL